ncbi:MAG TPA: metalloregulator ArsR/SmtB family transcription factor [Acidimicrobiia bacterium]|nr:metalloregulator ArsR/SmtB family transcription factor [Acidimicrobiia bacterium]
MAPARANACCTSVLEAPLRERDADDLAQAFAALADPVRLRVLSLIASAGEMCSCDLLAPLDRSQPTISHHTRVLADAGLIVGEKRGRWVWWSIVPGRLAEIRDALGSTEPARA